MRASFKRHANEQPRVYGSMNSTFGASDMGLSSNNSGRKRISEISSGGNETEGTGIL